MFTKSCEVLSLCCSLTEVLMLNLQLDDPEMTPVILCETQFLHSSVVGFQCNAEPSFGKLRPDVHMN